MTAARTRAAARWGLDAPTLTDAPLSAWEQYEREVAGELAAGRRGLLTQAQDLREAAAHARELREVAERVSEGVVVRPEDQEPPRLHVVR